MVMDPTEVMISGSMTGLLQQNSLENQYIPFSFGGSQSIVSKKTNDIKAWEFMGELGTFTQFEWKTTEGKQQRNLLNIDYRIIFSYNRKVSKTETYRLRFFHVSSHLGDDFLIRSEDNTRTSIISYTVNKVNYEQLDFTYFKKLSNHLTVYGGVGGVIRPNALRLPFSFFLGGQKEFRKENQKWAWTIAGNYKGFQETDFNPNVKLAMGRAYFSEAKTEPIRLVVEYYRGHLPYSQFEKRKTEWLGVGLYFYL